MKKLMLALSISLLFAPAAFAAGSAKAAANSLPPYGKDKPIPAPTIIKQTLANGLQVWVVPRQGLPRVDYVLAVRGAGLAADDSAHPGFANLMAGLLNEGSTKRDSRAIAEAAQGLGGEVGAGASHDGITVSANALTSNAGPMLDLLAEVARMPAFPSKEVELGKGNALEGLKVSEATPGFRAERALNKAVFGPHPYGNTSPTIESISTVTPELLRAEHAKRFRPDRSLLVITGRIGNAEAFKLATAAFGDWKAEGPALPETAGANLNVKPVRILLQRDGSVQSTMRLGSPGMAASATDYVPLRLTSTILGGGFSSRVNLNLREEKGYTYGASAGARIFRNGGSIVGGADVRNEVTGAALKEYLHEYTRIGSELVADAELSMNKRYVAGGYLINNQMQRAVAGTLANNWLVGLPPEFLGQYVPLIQKVTSAQVREMGKKYFAPELQSVIVVGDNAAVAEQLKQYGEFTVQQK
ncbi:M16 family metallopeptidase [Massilia antarctica]|uniref:M16 family metallopeptidase n=1 Tax=Massilia antarctica TaxID=2765360 RepID=UPI0006BB6C47|nr:pitrilysin family protein [Massilia sp. H27-R4]MCY0913858.1 pitrilysin family protein [Massilia sp. H27-R4]CUI04413.1 peptidase M16-like [Janthinobacterium sp. CG23_2]CUU28199.1 peptidase M16-like [Janthinobacterium sp. CG23_2]